MDLNAQRALFEEALEALVELPDLINQVLEVAEDENGEVSIIMYDLPSPEGQR
jgi:hypothetical protein